MEFWIAQTFDKRRTLASKWLKPGWVITGHCLTLFWMKYFFRKLHSFSCCLFYYRSSVIVYFKRFTITLCINKGAYPHHIFVRPIMSFQVAVFEPYLQFNSVQLLSRVWLFVTPGTAAQPGFPSITISRSLLKLISIESVVPSNHLTLCHPLLLLSIFPSIRVFSSVSVLHICEGSYRSPQTPGNDSWYWAQGNHA